MTARITHTVFVPVTEVGVHIFDAEARIYLVARQSRSGWHIVRPLNDEDYEVRKNGRSAGTLTCCCIGAQVHGHCWAIAAVERYEVVTADDAVWAEAVLG